MQPRPTRSPQPTLPMNDARPTSLAGKRANLPAECPLPRREVEIGVALRRRREQLVGPDRMARLREAEDFQLPRRAFADELQPVRVRRPRLNSAVTDPLVSCELVARVEEES